MTDQEFLQGCIDRGEPFPPGSYRVTQLVLPADYALVGHSPQP